MSVQAGIWNFDGRPVDHNLFASLIGSQSAFGPDGESCCVLGSVALAYRPFHTVAESRSETQPCHSREGFVLTWDGRIDNRQDLIADLRHDLEGDPSDAAIISAAFGRWGKNCFCRAVGDWAVSIWKPEDHELIFAVDYMSIRHIFYYLKTEQVWWSTDLSPLVLLSGDKFHVDDDYIAGYFANDPDSDLTPYREIREVPPGHTVRIRDGKVFIDRYWRFSPKSRIRYKSDAEYEEHFRHIFRRSVRRRLRSDSPILAELSGGLDSSSVVCMADDIFTREGAEAPRLDTLSYYDRTEPNGDDWTYFQKIEEWRGRVGTHIDVSKMGSSPASLEYSDFAPLPGYLGVGRNIEEERAAIVRLGGYRVVLSGLGGDEFLGGVPNPSAQLADLIVQFKLGRLTKQLIAWSLAKRRPWPHLLWEAFLHLIPPFFGQYLLEQAKVEPWIERDFARRTGLAVRQLDVTEHFGSWLPSRRSYIGGVLLMANKMAKNAFPSAACEEARYPYLDQDLIEFLLSIPADQLLRPGERRSLMRRSLIGIVPQDILSRRTKATSARTPIVALEKNWEELRAVAQSALMSTLGYVNRDRFLSAFQAARTGQIVNVVKLLSTVSLEFWLRDLVARSLLAGGAVPISPAGTESAGFTRTSAANKIPHVC